MNSQNLAETVLKGFLGSSSTVTSTFLTLLDSCWDFPGKFFQLNGLWGTISSLRLIGASLGDDFLPLDDVLGGNLASDLLILGLFHLEIIELIVVLPSKAEGGFFLSWIGGGALGIPSIFLPVDEGAS